MNIKYSNPIFPAALLALLIISACHKTHTTPMDAGPVNFELSRLAPTAVQLSWTDTSKKIVGFTIQRQTNFNKFEVIGTVGATTFGFVDTSLALNQVCNYRICSYDAAGTQSAFSAILTFSTYYTPQADTTYIITPVPAASSHNVFIEAFFGQSDVTGYSRDSILHSFQQLHSDRINILSLFLNDGGSASTPPPGAAYDLRSNVASELNNTMYNGGSGIPGASFDRAKYMGSFTPLLISDQWQGALNSRLSVSNPLNLSVTSLCTAGVATITATITYVEAMNTPQNISMFIVEDSIIDLHLMSTGVTDTTYVYNNVFRCMVTTGILGDRILDNFATKEPGRTLCKQYTFILPSTSPAINPAHCRIITLINSPGDLIGSGTDFEVLQSVQTKFAP